VKLSRELIRHGAEVFPIMSPSATKIIHPDALWFATGNKPIVELTGATEHVSFCGLIKKPADLLLISPCTANTISKIARGIDDTVVTTFATTAVGSGVPILVVPAMHLSMYDHKIVQKNIESCKKVGIKFIEPEVEKNKAKMAGIDEIVPHVIREIGKNDLRKTNILIIGGPTSEPIDDVRVVTNKSSGKTAVKLAYNAFCRGADVELLYGSGKELVPDYIKTFRFESVNDILKILKAKNLRKFDAMIVCAAISDYITKKQKGKIQSGKEKLLVEMTPAPKIISILRKKNSKAKLVAFKLEKNADKLHEKSLDLLKKNKLDFVVGNTISGFDSDYNEIWIVDKKGKSVHKKGSKEQLADCILDLIK